MPAFGLDTAPELFKMDYQDQVSNKIRKLVKENKKKPKDEKRPRKQLVAIAYSMAEKGKK